MDHLTIALVLIGLGVLMLLTEILMPTGGIMVVAALVFFAGAVGIIMDYGTTTEAAVAVVGLAVGLPAAGYVAVSAWRRMSLDSVLDDAAPVPPVVVPEIDTLKGRTGKTVSPLRPSGSVEFDGKRVDAMTEGTMLDAGVWVRCVEVRRGQVIVRKMDEPTDAPLRGPEPARKAEPAPGEEPKRDEPRKAPDDFDDFDIGLDGR